MLWTHPTTGDQPFPTPVLVQGVVYVASDTKVLALSTSDGKLLWSYTALDLPSIIGITNGVLYGVTGGQGSSVIFALNTSDGSEKWHYSSSNALSSQALADGVLYTVDESFNTGSPSLVALSTSDGSVKWHTPAADQFQDVRVAQGMVLALASIGQGSFIQAHKISDGSLAWQFPKNDSNTMMIGTANNMLFAVSDDGTENTPNPHHTIYALNLSTGATTWQTSIPQGNFLAVPTLLGSALYVGTSDNATLAAFNTADGKQLWKSQIGTPIQTDAVGVNVGAAVDGTVYVALPNNFVAVSASDGSVKWKAPASGLNTIAAVTDGIVFGSGYQQSGQVFTSFCYALKASDGSVLWKYTAPATFDTATIG